MARPCKNIDIQSRHNTKEEIERRKNIEESLKFNDDKIYEPPNYLNEEQKIIYKDIINELIASGILCNLDVFILSKAAISIERLQYIEGIINKKPSSILNKQLLSAKDKYDKDFFKCCNELSLSPQSRAKFGSLKIKAKEDKEDPVIQALKDDDDDEDYED